MRWRNERGAAAVEFALVLPFIVIILFATIDFGLTFTKSEDYESAAREGARFAALHCPPVSTCTPTTVWNAVRNASSDFCGQLTGNPPTCSNSAYINPPGACGTVSTDACGFAVSPENCIPGAAVAVSWTQTFRLKIPLSLLPPPIPKDIGNRVRTIRGVFRCE